MAPLRWLALLPPAAMLIGVAFFNRSTPLVLGMPLLLAWMVASVLLSAGVMAVIYVTDPANKER